VDAPYIRTLVKVTLEDAAKPDRTFDIVMGDAVDLRKRFIQIHRPVGKATWNLDTKH
jgi:DNA gyrase/topoisomerase IV subunit B